MIQITAMSNLAHIRKGGIRNGTYELVLDAECLHETVDIALAGGARLAYAVFGHEGEGLLVCVISFST